MSHLQCPQNYHEIYLDNIFQDIVPSMVIVGFPDNQAKNGSYLKNCYNFQPYVVRQIGIPVDGTYVPGLPQKLDFENGQNFVKAYKNFMGCQKTSADDVGISMKLFKNGYTFFSFSLDTEASSDKTR